MFRSIDTWKYVAKIKINKYIVVFEWNRKLFCCLWCFFDRASYYRLISFTNFNAQFLYSLTMCMLELARNLLAHAQKPHFIFRLNGRVHLNRRGSQFSRLLAAEVCASALVMVDTPRCEVVWEYWLPIPFASFPFTPPAVRHRVSSHSERSIHI